MPTLDDSQDRSIVWNRLLPAIESCGPDLALFLVYDRPTRGDERSGMQRSYFRQRCVSDEQLRATTEAFQGIGAYVELFEGERDFISALVSGRLARISRTIKIAYNGIEGSIAHDAFRPGRKALIPAVADSYGLLCANSQAYACALGRHKFHYLTVLRSLGLPVPQTWHYRRETGWAGQLKPPNGLKVIAKSTYESWSVGVTEDSVFHVGPDCTERIDAIAERIGQSVTVQEFIAGREICVPVYAVPTRFITPPVEAILEKAPEDPNAIMTIDDNLTNGAVMHRKYERPEEIERLRLLAISAFDALELDSFARIDFRVDASGTPFIFDVGVSPGIGTKSSAFRSISTWGLTYFEFLRTVIAASLFSEGMLKGN